MTPAGGVVQIMTGNNFVFNSLVVVLHAVLRIIALKYEQVFNRKLVILRPSDFQSFILFAWVCTFFDFGSVEKIKHFFVVNL